MTGAGSGTSAERAIREMAVMRGTPRSSSMYLRRKISAVSATEVPAEVRGQCCREYPEPAKIRNEIITARGTEYALPRVSPRRGSRIAVRRMQGTATD